MSNPDSNNERSFRCFKFINAALRNDDEIKSTILRSYFSFLRGVKSANSVLFKDFYNEVKMEKNK